MSADLQIDLNSPLHIGGDTLNALIREETGMIVAVRHRLNGKTNQAVMEKIVQCWNSHDALVEALESALKKGSKWHPCDPVVVQMKAALALAGKGDAKP